MGARSVMGASSVSYCHFEKRNREKYLRPYQRVKNKFERALGDESSQTIQGYRVKILQSGFTSKARKSNGKTILTLKTLEG